MVNNRGTRRLNVFERYLTLWVALCMIVGVGLGKLLPGLTDALRRMEFSGGGRLTSQAGEDAVMRACRSKAHSSPPPGLSPHAALYARGHCLQALSQGFSPEGAWPHASFLRAEVAGALARADSASKRIGAQGLKFKYEEP